VSKSDLKPKLCNWDCGYYVDIYNHGYGDPRNQSGTEAFYPAFPKIIKVLSAILPTQDFAWKATIFNLILYGLLLFVFLAWLELIRYPYPFLVLFFVSCDRFGLWSLVPYTETLFITSVFSYLFFIKKYPNSKIAELAAIFFGGFSTAVRLVGVACVAAFGINYIKRFLRAPHKGIFFLVLGCWGVIAYFAYLHFTQGAWDISLRAMAGWGRKFSLVGVFKSTYYLFKMFYLPTLFIFIGALWWIVRPPKHLQLSNQDRLCFLFLLFIPLASSNPTSLTRYLSLVYMGHIAFIYFLMKFFKRGPRFLQTCFWICFFLSEIYYQEALLEKFLRTESFSWAG
jgi:hypothetical protein